MRCRTIGRTILKPFAAYEILNAELAEKTMANKKSVEKHLLYLLKGDGAHLDFESAIKDLNLDLRGKRPKGGAHSPWEVLEHLRIAQRDILESIGSPGHRSPEFPAGYWPRTQAPPDAVAWEKSVAAFRADFEAVLMLVTKSEDLFAETPAGDGQTILRRLAMLADHNSYHLGELVLVRRVLGAWQ
jgi:hypothetical protein